MKETKNLIPVDLCDENGNVVTTIEIPADDIARLDRLAAKMGRSPDELLDEVLRNAIKQTVGLMAGDVKRQKGEDVYKRQPPPPPPFRTKEPGGFPPSPQQITVSPTAFVTVHLIYGTPCRVPRLTREETL